MMSESLHFCRANSENDAPPIIRCFVLFNQHTAPPCQELDDEQMAATDDLSIPVDAPTLSEVQSTIIVKLAPMSATFAIHDLLSKVWTSGHVPSQWKEGIITSLYKGKGPKSDCSSYRPISLLSVPGKVFTHVLLARIDPLLKSHRRPHQSGFTAERSTTDAILT